MRQAAGHQCSAVAVGATGPPSGRRRRLHRSRLAAHRSPRRRSPSAPPLSSPTIAGLHHREGRSTVGVGLPGSRSDRHRQGDGARPLRPAGPEALCWRSYIYRSLRLNTIVPRYAVSLLLYYPTPPPPPKPPSSSSSRPTSRRVEHRLPGHILSDTGHQTRASLGQTSAPPSHHLSGACSPPAPPSRVAASAFARSNRRRGSRLVEPSVAHGTTSCHLGDSSAAAPTVVPFRPPSPRPPPPSVGSVPSASVGEKKKGEIESERGENEKRKERKEEVRHCHVGPIDPTFS